MYFSNEDECAAMIGLLLDDEALLNRLKAASRQRHRDLFTWNKVLEDYETLLGQWIDVPQTGARVALRAEVLKT